MNRTAHRAPDPTYRSVLVPLDASRFAAGALPTARALSRRSGAELHTISVVPFDVEMDQARADAARALDTDRDDPRIHVEVDTDVAAAVHRWASKFDPCLICLSSHGRSGVAATLIGSTARDIIERGSEPVVLIGPSVVHADRAARAVAAPLEVNRLVACVDGTASSESALPVAAAWAHALGMQLSLVTVAEPCPPPVRIGAPWRRHHGPDEDADEYVRRLRGVWAPVVPGLDAFVVYDPIDAGSGMRDHLATHPAGLLAVTSPRRDWDSSPIFGSSAARIVHESSAPVLVIPAEPVAT